MRDVALSTCSGCTLEVGRSYADALLGGMAMSRERRGSEYVLRLYAGGGLLLRRGAVKRDDYARAPELGGWLRKGTVRESGCAGALLGGVAAQG